LRRPQNQVLLENSRLVILAVAARLDDVHTVQESGLTLSRSLNEKIMTTRDMSRSMTTYLSRNL
jgi:hypothetical protein